MALIGRRLEGMYPDKRNALIIPTQHNVITSYGDYAGVEVDCYSRGFNQKVQYFYRTSEVIEEARALGAGIVIPHPEQFWPILLADYDIDGIEVWNPQSRKYTEFLISVINQKNRCSGFSKRNLLIFMGDDTHMAEKTRAPEVQDQEKAGREIGYQPAWDDLSIRKALIRAGASRRNVIQEYEARLGQ